MKDRPEVKQILSILSEYVTDPIKSHIHIHISDVIHGESFVETSRMYTRHSFMSMLKSGELNFEFLKRMMVDSGVMKLFGDERLFPTTFLGLTMYIRSKTGVSVSETDMNSFLSGGVAQLTKSPQFNQVCEQFGMSTQFLNPILSFFNLNDKEEEKRKREEEKEIRKKKRMRKKIKKLNNSNNIV
jgi:hypothetical protein